MSTHSKGLLIAALGVLFISPDTLLIRLADADYWTTLFWRALFTSCGLCLLVWLMNGRKTAAIVKKLGRPGLTVALFFTISNLTFLAAIQLTTVANTLVILTSAPIFAALMGQLFLGHRTPLRTWMSMAVVIVAITAIFSEGLRGDEPLGNLCAVTAAIAMAASFVITQGAKTIDMTPAMALSSLLTASVAALFVPAALPAAETLLLFALLGACLTASFTLLYLAPRYISAAEVSLFLPLETVLGTAAVWWIIGEEPSTQAIFGGLAIIVALMLNSFIGIRQNQTP